MLGQAQLEYTEPVTFSGAVLAGGRSKRFGSDKARFVLGGEPLLSRVLMSLAEASERFVVADRDYSDFGVPVYPDDFAVQSPLSGLYTALERAREDWVAVAACDLPNLTPGYWATLARHHEGARAVVVRRGDRLEPLAALYHRDLAGSSLRHLESGNLTVHRFVESVDACVLDFASLALPSDLLANLNTLPDTV